MWPEGEAISGEKIWGLRWSQLTAAAFLSRSALFIAQNTQLGTIDRSKWEREKEGITATSIFLYCWSCGLCPAQCSLGHTYTHMYTHFDNISSADSLGLHQMPCHAGIDFCSWQHEKRENFMMSISPRFYPTSAILCGNCARCLHRLLAKRVATVCWRHACLLYFWHWQMVCLSWLFAQLV